MVIRSLGVQGGCEYGVRVGLGLLYYRLLWGDDGGWKPVAGSPLLDWKPVAT